MNSFVTKFKKNIPKYEYFLFKNNFNFYRFEKPHFLVLEELFKINGEYNLSDIFEKYHEENEIYKNVLCELAINNLIKYDFDKGFYVLTEEFYELRKEEHYVKYWTQISREISLEIILDN